MTVRIGRVLLDLHRSALYIAREPDPNCPDCRGSCGGWIPNGANTDWDECHCLSQLRTWTLRLWPRRNPAKEYPF
ncbi:hypothetical protein ABT154_21615 [Streptomyces sp. NPDC001728]|uniref:hypothetical protein n=1 Tax=Streptomyces sp. NPDC001728 TaxID=3154396 RepID=UPI00332E0441